MNGTINELKQGLLKCANENEGVIYLAEQVDISSICKDANNTIERLEKENEQLKSQIKKMKKCLICIHFKVHNECSDNEYYTCELKECNNLDKWELVE